MAADKLTARQRAAQKKQMKQAEKKLQQLQKEVQRKQKQLEFVKRKLERVLKPNVRRHERLTMNDQDLREIRNELISSNQHVGRISGKDKYTDHVKLPGFLLTRTKKHKPRMVVADLGALGLTRAEAKKQLGGTTVTDLLKSSVQFTWRPYTRLRQGDERFEYRGYFYGAADRSEQTVVVPFRVFQRFLPYVDLDADKKGGVIPPGTFEHWARVMTSLIGGDFKGSDGVERFTDFVNNNINKSYDKDEEDIKRPHQTVIAIRNITYHNLNNQEPTQAIDEMPFGFFALNMSHETLYHYTNDSDTWDNLIQPERTPTDMEGLEGICGIKGVWLAIRDSMYKTKERAVGSRALDTEGSSFRLNFRFLWDLAKNFRGHDANRWPIFIPRDDPAYRDYLTAEERAECDKYDCITDLYEARSDKVSDLRLTLKELKTIFDHFYLNVVVRDEHGNMLWYCVRSLNNNKWRSNLDFIAKNGHLYLCPNKVDSRIIDSYQTLDNRHGVDRFSEPMTCTARFKVPKPINPCESDNRLRLLVEDDWRTIPDLVAKTLSTTKDNSVIHFYVPTRTEEGERGNVRYLNDLRQLYCLFKEKGFEAEIRSLKDRAYGMLRLQRFITPLQPKGVVVNIEALSPKMTTIEEEDALRKARDALDRRIFIKTVMSTFSEEGRKWYGDAQGGAIGNTCDNPDEVIDSFGAKMVLEVDTRSQHPFALSQMKSLPVCNNFDNPQPYDKEQYKKDYGSTYEFYTSYLVEFHVPNHLFRSQGKCTGMELFLGYKPCHYTITHYFRPSKLVPSHVFNEIANFMENSGLDEKIKKGACMPVCGKLGKQVNTSSAITHFETKEEMQHYRRRYKGSTVMVTTVDENTYYTVARHLQTQLVEGFRPIYFMMLGLSRLQQWQTIRKIRAKAVILQSVTDAVRFLIPKNADICSSVIQHQQEGTGELDTVAVLKYLGFGDQMVDKSKPYREQAGKLKALSVKVEKVKGAYETNILSPNIVARIDPPRTITPTVTRFCLPDEFDVEGSTRFLVDLMEKYRRLNVVGEFPGVGKSFACRLMANHVKEMGGEVIALAQYWENVQEFRDLVGDKDFRSLYSAFSVAFNGEDLDHMDENGKVKNNSKKKPIRFSKYKLVIIDEIFTADIVSLKKIVDVLFTMYPDLWIITNGDVGQLPAVNTAAINNIPEHMRGAYSESIVNGLFPHQLVIRQVKRARCVKHQVTYTPAEIRDCADCQVKRHEYIDRVETIRNANDVKDAYEKLKAMFSKNILTSLEQLKEKGVTAAVSYTNSCAEVANMRIHAEVSRKAGHKGKMYWPGMSLIAKRGMKLAQVDDKEDEEVEDDIEEVDIEEEVSKEYVRIYTNHMYTVKAVQQKRLKLVDPERETEWFWVKRDKEANALSAQIDHFVLPYCRTGHSFQGKTINEPFCIFEGDHPHVTREWLVVACTRNIDPDTVYIYTGKDYLPLKTEVDKRKELEMAERELKYHKKSDLAQFGSIEEGDGFDRYATPQEYLETLRNTQRCSHPECQNYVGLRKGQHSYDRINGGVRHWISNCRFVCSLSCNSSMRPSYGL